MSALIHRVAATLTPTPSGTPSSTATPSPSSCPCITPAPAPGIGDTVALAAPWQWTLPLLITVLLGVATAIGIIATIVQKSRADRRQQLWNRMQWALNAMTSTEEETAVIGYLAVQHLADSQQLDKKHQPPIPLTKYDQQLLSQSLRALD